MDTQKVDMYIMANSKYFESHQIAIIRDMLLKADESRWMNIQALDLKDPITMLIISLLGGQLGIDRFVLGETGLGLAKLLTCGGLGIWAIVDWFLIMGRAKEINMQKLQMALY
jgi:TM2 domain-containing membrane protein YozV